MELKNKDQNIEGSLGCLRHMNRHLKMVQPEGVEPPTAWFEARNSIQLSYGCTWGSKSLIVPILCVEFKIEVMSSGGGGV